MPKPSFPAGLTLGGGTITNVPAPVASTDAANKFYVDNRMANVRSAMLADKVWPVYVLANGNKGVSGPYTSMRLGVGTEPPGSPVTPLSSDAPGVRSCSTVGDEMTCSIGMPPGSLR